MPAAIDTDPPTDPDPADTTTAPLSWPALPDESEIDPEELDEASPVPKDSEPLIRDVDGVV